jgi:hypothetical protein
MAALEQLKIHAEELYEAHSVAEDAICDSTIGNVVTLAQNHAKRRPNAPPWRANFSPPQATLLRPWPKRLAPAMLNSSKSCDTYSLTKPAYLAGRQAATKISAIILVALSLQSGNIRVEND